MYKRQVQQIQIELPPEEAQGIYSNFFIISHSPSEFVIDFSRLMPGLQKARVFARIILTPQHAKRLYKTLEDNIKKFEDKFGEIKVEPEEKKKIIGFKPEDA